MRNDDVAEIAYALGKGLPKGTREALIRFFASIEGITEAEADALYTRGKALARRVKRERVRDEQAAT